MNNNAVQKETCDAEHSAESNLNISAFPSPPSTKPTVDLKILVVQMIFGGLLGCVIVSTIVWLLPRVLKEFTGLDFVFLLSAMLLGFVPSIILHEFGHAVMGWFTGMRMLMVNLGPVSIVNRQNQWTLERLRGARAFMGMALFLPKVSTSRFRLALYILGGPLANFLQVAILVFIASISTHWIAVVCFGLSFSALLLGLINLLPLHTRGVATDGAQLLDLIKGGQAFEARMKILHLGMQAMNGVPLEDVSLEDIEEAVATSKVPGRFMLYLYPHAVALKGGDAIKARRYLHLVASHYAQFPEGMRQPAALQIGVFLFWVDRDAELASAWLELGKGGVVSIAERAQGDAVGAWLSGDYVKAKRNLQEARAALPKCLDQSWAKYLDWQLHRIELDMTQALAESKI